MRFHRCLELVELDDVKNGSERFFADDLHVGARLDDGRLDELALDDLAAEQDFAALGHRAFDPAFERGHRAFVDQRAHESL